MNASIMAVKEFQFDRIGTWSEIKLEVLKNYAGAYSKILAAQRNPSLHHIYIDAFAGAGVHVTKATDDFVLGSPLNALNVRPPFMEYHLIDTDRQKVAHLRQLIGERQDVFIYEGDCNRILLDKVFPRARYEDYRRALCILDPYGLHLDWTVMYQAGQMKTIDMFLNFPVTDMNRNVLWSDPDKVDPANAARMNAFWGDASWSQIAYDSPNLFGFPEKVPNEVVAEAFRKRLKKVAGFRRVPEPLPMKNSSGSTLYYLFFASDKDTAEKVVIDVFNKYRQHRST